MSGFKLRVMAGVFQDEELGLKERLKRQQSRAGEKDQGGVGK
jgi:hypothetical protein